MEKQTELGKASLVGDALTDFIKKISEKGFNPKKIFIKHNLNESMVLISIPESIHDSDEFINFVYPSISEIENKFLENNLNLDISFVDDTENLNITLIKDDGFSFVYDLTNQSEII